MSRRKAGVRLRQVPRWVWIVEAAGLAMVCLGWAWSGYAEATLLQFGSALMLVLPLALFDRGLEERLTQRIDEAVSKAVSEAQGFKLSWEPSAANPEDLAGWPFTATAKGDPSGNVRLALRPTPKEEHGEPIEAMIIVEDPKGRTFNLRAWDQTGRLEGECASFLWPDQFTSGDDIPSGRHLATWFVMSLEAGPQAQRGRACSIEFHFTR